MFFGRKTPTTLDLLLPTQKQTGRDIKIERQFIRRRGAVVCKFYGGTLPVFQTANLMTGWQDHSLNESIAVSKTERWPWHQPAGFTPTKCS
jgi:hypothetical protein